MTFWSTLQFLIPCTEFEVRTVVVIHCVFWLGKRMAWYIGVNVVKGHSGFVFPGH
jgi:hypothetical protein